jgi:exodeoxyribonuclease VII large subunit
VAIIGRGGGSREDLWCFNDERLARKVAACPIPIISAVGHEIDVTICDLVADFRAQTPSAAAERAVPLLADVRREVRLLGRRLADACRGLVKERRRALLQMSRRTTLAASTLIDRRRLRVQGLAGKLHVLSPLATLGRGYALIATEGGQVVTSAASLATGDTISIRFRDGQAGAEVTSVERQASGEA